MSTTHLPPDDPNAWLKRAYSNLVRAQTRVKGVLLEDLCFDAQQAAEKSLKALLVARHRTFPFIHDLARLLTLVEQAGYDVPVTLHDIARLTRYAVATRYPTSDAAVTEEEYQQAVHLAEQLLRWVEVQLAQPTSGPKIDDA